MSKTVKYNQLRIIEGQEVEIYTEQKNPTFLGSHFLELDLAISLLEQEKNKTDDGASKTLFIPYLKENFNVRINGELYKQYKLMAENSNTPLEKWIVNKFTKTSDKNTVLPIWNIYSWSRQDKMLIAHAIEMRTKKEVKLSFEVTNLINASGLKYLDEIEEDIQYIFNSADDPIKSSLIKFVSSKKFEEDATIRCILVPMKNSPKYYASNTVEECIKKRKILDILYSTQSGNEVYELLMTTDLRVISEKILSEWDEYIVLED
jgi:hypothetical protein